MSRNGRTRSRPRAMEPKPIICETYPFKTQRARLGSDGGGGASTFIGGGAGEGVPNPRVFTHSQRERSCSRNRKSSLDRQAPVAATIGAPRVKARLRQQQTSATVVKGTTWSTRCGSDEIGYCIDKTAKTKSLPPPLHFVDLNTAKSQACNVNTESDLLGSQRMPIPNVAPATKMTAKLKSVDSTDLRRTESWNKKLSQNSTQKALAPRTEFTSFHGFDPIRTVNFLTGELQSILREKLPSNNGLVHLVSDIQQVLKRFPPDVTSKPPSPNNDFKDTTDDREFDADTAIINNEDKVIEVSKVESTDKGCQTAKTKNIVLEPEKFQQHLESTTQKIEAACKQMEIVCSKLKLDKETLELQLQAERDANRILQQQMKLQHKDNVMVTCNKSLELENERMKAEVAQLKAHQKAQLNIVDELKSILQQLQKQKSASEVMCHDLQQQLTLASMESEKNSAILAARDRQVKEMRSQINTLQEVVKEQLNELQRSPFGSSAATTTVNLIDSLRMTCMDQRQKLIAQQKSDTPANLTISSIDSKESNDDSFKNFASENWNSNCSMVNSGNNIRAKSIHVDAELFSATAMSSRPDDAVTSEIRNMFTEIRKQACLVNMPRLADATSPLTGGQLEARRHRKS